MLPPVLEIFVVWHPGDRAGASAADDFVQHFHGTRFVGLVGGAVEVYVRSVGWRGPDDAPRPIPFPDAPALNGIMQAQLVAVVPVLGTELAAAVEGERVHGMTTPSTSLPLGTPTPGALASFP